MADQKWMLFHEVYGSYYNTVAKILEKAVDGDLSSKEILNLVQRYAFAESWNGLTESLSNGDWPFLNENMGTELRRKPIMPLTTLQKRWLKTMLQDPRIRLFLEDGEIILPEEVVPLFDWKDIVYFDRYQDGDPYEDPQYIKIFRKLLTALRRDSWLEVTYRNRRGESVTEKAKPVYLEYSPRDDKFRIHCAGTAEHIWPGTIQINLARIIRCELIESGEKAVLIPSERRMAELILTDRRGLLERFMRLFCYLEKKTVPLEDAGEIACYRVELYYEPTDEGELIIRLLSMGNDIRILSPESLRQEIAARVQRQRSLLLSEKNKNSRDGHE